MKNHVFPLTLKKMYKPKLALVADQKNWAFANIARQIKSNLNDSYNIDIVYLVDYTHKPLDLFKDLFLSNYQLVHFLWRGSLKGLLLPSLWKNFSDLEKLILRVNETAITTSIYDHLFLNENEKLSFQPIFEWLVDGYTVSSQRLFNIYEQIPKYQKPKMVIQDGVDLSLFYKKPNSHAQLNNTNNQVIGWVGNSKWGKFGGRFGTDHKGFHTIIQPAIRSLQKKGINIEGLFADKNIKMIPIEKMVDYYNTIDVYVCASDIEGTPNPVLEAMACGLPVISTDVGIVPEIFGEKQSAFIIPRSVEALETQLQKLLTEPNLRKSLAEENLAQIKNFTREKEAQKWHTFFSQTLENRKNVNISQKVAKFSTYFINQTNKYYVFDMTIRNIVHIFAGIERI